MGDFKRKSRGVLFYISKLIHLKLEECLRITEVYLKRWITKSNYKDAISKDITN